MHYIQPGKPDQNAYIERFNRSYRTEVLNAHLFESIAELRALTDAWLRIYNSERPHDSLGRVPPLTFLPRPSSAGSVSYRTVCLTGKLTLGSTVEDDLALEALGIKGFASAGLGASVMHDSRDNEDMPTTGWFLNVNNIAYREALGGAESFDAYRVDLKTFWQHGGGHVLAVRHYNWLSSDAPSAAEATVILRGYKQGSTSRPTCPHSKSKNACHSTRDGAPRCLLVWRDYTASNRSRSTAAPIPSSGRACTS